MTLEIKSTETQDSRLPSIDWNHLPLGAFTDHMLSMDTRRRLATRNHSLRAAQHLSGQRHLHYGQSISRA
jgi:hypothetical protein